MFHQPKALLQTSTAVVRVLTGNTTLEEYNAFMRRNGGSTSNDERVRENYQRQHTRVESFDYEFNDTRGLDGQDLRGVLRQAHVNPDDPESVGHVVGVWYRDRNTGEAGAYQGLRELQETLRTSTASAGEGSAPPESAANTSPSRNTQRPNAVAEGIAAVTGPVAGVAGAIGQLAILGSAASAQAANRAREQANQAVAMVASGYAQASARASDMSQMVMLQLQRSGQDNLLNQMAFVTAMRTPPHQILTEMDQVLPHSPTARLRSDVGSGRV